MAGTPDVAIAFIVREKFSWALTSVDRLYRATQIPFSLYVVDCGYPPEVLSKLEHLLADKPNVVWIKAERYLLPNESLNLVIPRVSEEFLCVVQNDVLIEPGFVEGLRATLEQYACDIAEPDVQELDHQGVLRPHRHEYTDSRIQDDGQGGLFVQVTGRPSKENPPPIRLIHHFELHTLMLRTRAAKLLAPLPVINTREHIDVAIGAFRAGLKAYVNETVRASYVLPPIREYDLEYFKFRWDLTRADESHWLVIRRWGIRNMPNSMPFIRAHIRFADADLVLPNTQT